MPTQLTRIDFMGELYKNHFGRAKIFITWVGYKPYSPSVNKIFTNAGSSPTLSMPLLRVGSILRPGNVGHRSPGPSEGPMKIASSMEFCTENRQNDLPVSLTKDSIPRILSKMSLWPSGIFLRCRRPNLQEHHTHDPHQSPDR